MACGELATPLPLWCDTHGVDAAAALERLGGVAPGREVALLSSRRKLRTAVRRGDVRRVSWDRYALPTAEEARAAAARVHGYVSHLSAASAHGWQLHRQPDRPQVCVPRGRKMASPRREGVDLRWLRLAAGDVEDGLTTPIRTIVDCARDLPFEEALAVADSALRSGLVLQEECLSAAREVRGPGAIAVRRVARLADGRAENAFESALRAHALDAGLDVLPQQSIDLGFRTVCPDLVDTGRRLVVEADSWTYHAEKSAFTRDIERYNDLVLARHTTPRAIIASATCRKLEMLAPRT